jgi:hypothetical protein
MDQWTVDSGSSTSLSTLNGDFSSFDLENADFRAKNSQVKMDFLNPIEKRTFELLSFSIVDSRNVKGGVATE